MLQVKKSGGLVSDGSRSGGAAAGPHISDPRWWQLCHGAHRAGPQVSSADLRKLRRPWRSTRGQRGLTVTRLCRRRWLGHLLDVAWHLCQRPPHLLRETRPAAAPRQPLRRARPPLNLLFPPGLPESRSMMRAVPLAFPCPGPRSPAPRAGRPDSLPPPTGCWRSLLRHEALDGTVYLFRDT